MVDMARQIADKNGWELVVLRTWLRPELQNQIQDVTAGPREFVTYVHNAQFIVTNSFHGTVFSILFRKRFFSVYKQGSNNRIQDLLDGLSLSDRHLEYQLPEKESQINWEQTYRLLDEKRSMSYQFLEDSLS